MHSIVCPLLYHTVCWGTIQSELHPTVLSIQQVLYHALQKLGMRKSERDQFMKIWNYVRYLYLVVNSIEIYDERVNSSFKF